MDTLIQIILALVFIFGRWIYRYVNKQNVQQPEDLPAGPHERELAFPEGFPRDDDEAPDDGAPGAGPMTGSPGSAWTPAGALGAEGEAVRGRLDELIREAEERLASARIDPATARPAQVIEDYVLPRARDARQELGPGETQVAIARARLVHLTTVLGAVERLVAQRRRPELREPLGDADALARACYQPVLDFARMNRVALTSAHPVALLTPFDMGIWVGFIPTGVAPLFLPPTFFEDLRWWPAVAHEIGHDFLAASPGLDARLREQLGVPPEAAGARPIDIYATGSLPVRELVRIHGAWFEEIFCDLFGTMMLGPAYGHGMVALFARPEAPVQVTTAAVTPDGLGYDPHPPRHLRVLLCTRALRLMGEDEAADEIRDEWTALHGDQPALWIPTTRGTVGVPTEVVVEIGDQIITGLYREGMAGLDGHAMADIPGLDHGPHQAAELRRARDQLLAGQVPSDHKARAVVAGAVLAWRQEPARQATFLALARQAIVGVTESRRDLHADAYALAGSTARSRHEELREAFLLHTVLAPPPSVRRLRPGVRRGFLARLSGR